MKKTSWPWFAGIVGGVTAVTCCIAPVVLVILGFGTSLSMMIMHHFHKISIISGIIFMILLSLWLIKRKTGVCNIKSVSSQWKGIIAAVAVMVVSLYAINYLIVEPIADKVYGDLEIQKAPLGNIEEMAQLHNMPEMADIKVVPENEGMKQIDLKIEGIYCGSCGPAIEYDIKSIEGVEEVTRKGNDLRVIYNSDSTNKKIIMQSIHAPYTASLIEEKQYSAWTAEG